MAFGFFFVDVWAYSNPELKSRAPKQTREAERFVFKVEFDGLGGFSPISFRSPAGETSLLRLSLRAERL